MGKALYRKYRPLRLQDVVGQEPVIKSLELAIKQDKISHAYLFTGPRGCGKTSVARIFAHEINHFKYNLEDSYVDVIELDAASNRGIEDIRELREKAAIAPTEGKYKVYILDEVHMLTREAFNAFLKILEEPPAHVVFIMATTNPEKLPVTITSRAAIYSFSLAPAPIMTTHLQQIAKAEKISITDEALAVVVKRGGGSFRDSISLLDQLSTLSTGKITAKLVEQALGLPQAELIQNLLQAFASGDASAITTSLATAINAGVKEEALVEELLEQIIANPLPEYLPLLAKLPDVTAPFITAKLLTAFLGEGNINRTAPSLAGLGAARVTTSEGDPRRAQRREHVGGGEVGRTSAANAADFSWSDFLTKVEQNGSASVYNSLVACQHLFVDGTLHLYPKKLGERILNSPNNKAILTAELGAINLAIHTASETPPVLDQPTQNNSSPLAQVFDIIDGTQEVNYAGELPFN